MWWDFLSTHTAQIKEGWESLWDGFIPAPRAPGQAAVGKASPWNPGHLENLVFFLLMIQSLANARH